MDFARKSRVLGQFRNLDTSKMSIPGCLSVALQEPREESQNRAESMKISSFSIFGNWLRNFRNQLRKWTELKIHFAQPQFNFATSCEIFASKCEIRQRQHLARSKGRILALECQIFALNCENSRRHKNFRN